MGVYSLRAHLQSNSTTTPWQISLDSHQFFYDLAFGGSLPDTFAWSAEQKWGLELMKTYFQIAYVFVGFVQFFAVWDGVELFFGANSFFAFLIALFLNYIPLVGSVAGVYGAINVWDWSLVKSLLLFFWYVPVYIAFIGYAFVADRGR